MQLSKEALNILIVICVGIEVLTAITATVFYYKYRDTKVLKYILFFFWYIVLNDFVGLYLRFNQDSNTILYNIYNVINFSFFLILYRHHLKGRLGKKVVLIFWVVYLLSFIINGFYENYLIKHQSLPYIFGAVFLLITIILYFIEILNSEKVLSAKKNLLFWISVGLLIYYVGNIPFRILRNYYKEVTDASLATLVNLTVGVTMYTCFIIGFIWSDKRQEF